MSSFSKGDKVSWNSSSGKVHGTIVKKLESDTTIGDHTVRASKESPQYLVESSSTGAHAAHKPESLTKD
jgi:hypothetical protein